MKVLRHIRVLCVDTMKGMNSKETYAARFLCGANPRHGMLPAIRELGIFPAERFAWGFRSPEDGFKLDFAGGRSRFLNDLEKANFQYFWEQAKSKNRSLVREVDATFHANGGGTVGNVVPRPVSGLTALCIGEKRGFVSHSPAVGGAGPRPPSSAFGRNCRIIADSSTIGPISILANVFGTQKFLPLTLPSCSAVFWRAGSTSRRQRSKGWLMPFLIEWNGPGCLKTLLSYLTAGRRRWGFFPTAGTTTAN